MTKTLTESSKNTETQQLNNLVLKYKTMVTRVDSPRTVGSVGNGRELSSTWSSTNRFSLDDHDDNDYDNDSVTFSFDAAEMTTPMTAATDSSHNNH